MTKLRGIEAKDLYKLYSAADPRLSPDGSKAAYVQTAISEKKNDYYSNIYVLDLNANKAWQWTYGENRNHSPRWSADGKKIAFVSNRSGKNQLYLLDTEGGEAKRLTNLKSGASNPVWFPDGSKIAFSVSIKPGEKLEEDKEEKEKKEELKPVEVERMKYKSDASGLLDGKYQQIACLHLDSGEIELLTEGEVSRTLYAFSPDGKYLLYGADYAEDKDFSFVEDIYLLDLETKTKKRLTTGKGNFYNPVFSSDGKYIAMYGHEQEYANATLAKIWIYDVAADNLTCISKDWEMNVGDYAIGDFQQGAVTRGAFWNKAADGLYFTASHYGSTNIYYTDLKGNYRKVTDENAHIYGLSITPEGKAAACISTPVHPGDVFEVNLTTGETLKRTDINGSFLQNILLAEPEPIEFKGAKDWTVHGWIMKPVHFRRGEKYPLVLEVHGGPHMMYANSYFHEFQMLAAAGYVVLYTNPRGSHGYGQKFVDAVRGDYGGGDYEDVMAAVDYAVKTFEYIDEERLGITGGSYGGFMTNWVVGQTNRFKAAVTQRSISNWVSFYGVSDIGYYFNEWQHKLDMNDIEGLWKISPLAYVENVTTPLLILHSERDFRCPIEQAEQLYIALKHRKKPVKFIRFPESNHELSRSGKPNLRIARLQYILDWFNKHLN